MGSIYRTQGKWKNIDFLQFKSHPKQSPDPIAKPSSSLDISKIYVDVEALENMGFSFPEQKYQQKLYIPGGGVHNKPFYKLLDFLIQNPTSDIAVDIFSGFFEHFEETETREVSEDVDFNEAFINGVGIKTEVDKVDEPKENDILDVKVEVDFDEDFIYDAYSEDDEQDEDYVVYKNKNQKKKKTKVKKLNHNILIQEEPLENKDTKSERNDEVTLPMQNFEEDNVIKTNKTGKFITKTSAEKRFLLRCEEFQKSANLSEYYFCNPHLGSITCLVCSQVLTSKVQHSTKIRTHLVEKVVDHILVDHFLTYAHKCQDCQAEFQNAAQVTVHRRCCQNTDNQTFKCKVCGERFSQETDLKNHVSSSHDSLTVEMLICNQCGLMFKTEKCRITHEKKIHGIEPSGNKKKRKRDPNLPNGGAPRVICPTCGIEVCTKWVLEKHMKTHHENAFPEPKICHLCKENEKSVYNRRKFFTPYALEQHLTLYHKDGPESSSSICHYCSEEFRGAPGTINKELKTHIEKVHLGIRYNCDECGKVFMTSKTLASHQKHVHRQEGRYPCKECGKVFKYTLQAIEHAYKDRGEAPHQCKNCDFKSAHSWALAKHKPLCRFS